MRQSMASFGFGERMGRGLHLAFCAAVLIFLIAPMLVVIPLSFNAEPYFTFTEGMLSLDPEAYSLRWYRNVIEDGIWQRRWAFSRHSASRIQRCRGEDS